MKPSTTARSRTASVPSLGSIDAHAGQEEGGRRIGQAPEAVPRHAAPATMRQHRHADRHAVLDLATDEAARPVGELRAELDALVRRPGMQDRRAGRGQSHARLVEAPASRVLAQRRHAAAGRTLELDAKRHDRVGAVERRHASVPPRRRPGRPSKPRTQAGGPPSRTRAPERHQGVQVRARHPRVRDVADDRHRASVERARAPRAASARRASAWVGWACVPSPAFTIAQAGALRAARYGAPDAAWRRTTVVTPVRSRVRSVSTSDSPFADAAAGDRQVDDRGAERLGGELEADARSGRCLVEGEPHRLGLQQGPMGARRRAPPASRSARSQMRSISSRLSPSTSSRWRRVPAPGRGLGDHAASSGRSMTTSSASSVSSRRTWTISSSPVGRFLPTKSGRIGSSRWPRSTSTASRTARGRP